MSPNPSDQRVAAGTPADLPQFPRVIPGLDGLRGAGVLMVVFAHHYFDVLVFGWIAVQMFFVLSGFLITNGLLQTRDRPGKEYLRVFYWHRLLRLAPPYYVYLLILSVVACFVPIEGTGPLPIVSAALYVYNFYHASAFFEASYTLTHFWSLAVEEQFYLLWPLMLFFLRGQALRRALWILVIAGPLLRTATAVLWTRTSLPVLPDAALSIYVLPWSHFDAFAMGAMVSLGVIRPSRKAVWLAIAAAALLGLLQLMAFPEVRIRSLGYPFTLKIGNQFVWGYTVVNLCGAFIVAALSRKLFLPWCFDNPVLAYLGRISYTVYIIHYPLQLLVDSVAPSLPLPLRILIQLAIAICLAELSRRYIEVPARRLRDRWR